MKQHHKLFDLTGKTIVVAGGAGGMDLLLKSWQMPELLLSLQT